MKILFLATDAYGGRGGIAYYNRCLTEALAAMQEVQEVVVLVRHYKAPVGQVPDKVRFITASAGGKLRYIAASLAQSLNHYDLIICGHINLLPLAGVIVKYKSIPLVLQVHGTDVWQPASSAMRWLGKVDAVWSVSAVTRDRMNEWAKLPATKYTIIPNTIRIDRYGIAPKRNDLLERYGLKDRKIIATMGRLASSERYKGFDEILEALPSLIKHVPNLGYLILGDGDDRPRLEAKVKSMGLADRVRFAGYVNDQEKADYLRLCDVFAMPGRGEGFGIVYLEAMACGVPVVGSQLDGSREALLDGTLGVLVNPDNTASLQEGILTALTMPHQIPSGLEYFLWKNFVIRVEESTRNLLYRSSKA